MTPEEIFDKAIQPNKRFVPPSSGTESANVYEVCLQRTLRLFEIALPKPWPNVFFVDDPMLQAFAFVREGASFIGIHHGLLSIVRDTFHRMLARPDTFPTIGNPAMEVDSGFAAPPTMDERDMAYGRPPELWVVRAKDGERLEYAELLFHIAFDFIMWHEAAHIYNGHYDLKQSIGGESKWFEIALEEHDRRGALPLVQQQMLELDADSFGVMLTLKLAVNQNRAPPDRLERAIITWGTAIHTLFHIFYGTHVDVSHGNRTDKSHLPPHLRVWHAMATAVSGAPIWFGAGADDLVARLGNEFIGRVEAAYAKISGRDVNLSGLAAARELSDSLGLARFHDAWAELYPRLQQFARIRLVPPDPGAVERAKARTNS